MGSTQDRAATAAQETLEIYGWDGDSLPIEPAVIAQWLGVDTFTATLANEVAGALVLSPGHDPAIMLNRGDSRNRQRFTCAHELGHYIQRLNEGRADVEEEVLDFRDTIARQGTNLDEIFANAFAAELLMPEALLRKLRREGLTVSALAGRFDVSGEAMTYRLKNLGLHLEHR